MFLTFFSNIRQECFPNSRRTLTKVLKDRIFELEIDLLEQELPRILLNQNSRSKQDDRLASHYKPRNAEDGKFSWQETSDSIYNLIRALVNPWPGAFFYTDEGEKIIIDYFLEKKYIEEIQSSKIYYSKFLFDKYIEKNGIRQN